MKTHISKINKFISKAENIAKERVKEQGTKFQVKLGRDGGEYSYCFFSRYFHEEMDRMTKEAGLRI